MFLSVSLWLMANRSEVEAKMQADPELANVLAVLQGKAADEVRSFTSTMNKSLLFV